MNRIYNENAAIYALQEDMRSYESAIADLSDVERNNLREWVLGGNSVFDNPYHMSDDNGRPINYIEALRITADMRENPELYGIQGGASYV